MRSISPCTKQMHFKTHIHNTDSAYMVKKNDYAFLRSTSETQKKSNIRSEMCVCCAGGTSFPLLAHSLYSFLFLIFYQYFSHASRCRVVATPRRRRRKKVQAHSTLRRMYIYQCDNNLSLSRSFLQYFQLQQKWHERKIVCFADYFVCVRFVFILYCEPNRISFAVFVFFYWFLFSCCVAHFHWKCVIQMTLFFFLFYISFVVCSTNDTNNKQLIDTAKVLSFTKSI